jgi:NAD(P)-dependent dehydrogenase (short-subunit alcohol dehydrogenase family)
VSTGNGLDGQTVIVTGAGRGIGRSVAEYLAGLGSCIVCVDPGVGRDGSVTTEDVSSETVQAITAAGGRAIADSRSVASFDDAAGIVASAIETTGRLDALVNCAGILREKMIWNMPAEDWAAVTSVHLNGTFNMCRQVAGHFRGQRAGRIVNMSSTAWLGTVGQSNYGASKGGIVSLTYALARELGRYGVTANAVCPSAATRMTVTPEVTAGIEQRYRRGLVTEEQYRRSMNRPGPEYIAPLVAYLLSEAAADVNGQVFKAHRGHIGRYSVPAEVNVIEKSEDDDGMFTLEEIDAAFHGPLLAGYTNPAPADRS